MKTDTRRSDERCSIIIPAQLLLLMMRQYRRVCLPAILSAFPPPTAEHSTMELSLEPAGVRGSAYAQPLKLLPSNAAAVAAAWQDGVRAKARQLITRSSAARRTYAVANVGRLPSAPNSNSNQTINELELSVGRLPDPS